MGANVILSREDGEGSPASQLEILRFAQDDGESKNLEPQVLRVVTMWVPIVILSREDGEGSPASQLEILRFAQDDGNLTIAVPD